MREGGWGKEGREGDSDERGRWEWNRNGRFTLLSSISFNFWVCKKTNLSILMCKACVCMSVCNRSRLVINLWWLKHSNYSLTHVTNQSDKLECSQPSSLVILRPSPFELWAIYILIRSYGTCVTKQVKQNTFSFKLLSPKVVLKTVRDEKWENCFMRMWSFEMSFFVEKKDKSIQIHCGGRCFTTWKYICKHLCVAKYQWIWE